MHAAYLGNVLRIIREQTRQKDARRKPIPARIRWFQPGTTETLVSEIRPDFKLRCPNLGRFQNPKTCEGDIVSKVRGHEFWNTLRTTGQ